MQGGTQGIDVSHYQGTIDWAAVRQAGCSFVFIKATDGVTNADPMFQQNWTQAQQAGLLRGPYHFFRANDDPQTQAHFFCSTVGSPGDLPPVLDVEITSGVSNSQILSGVQTWLQIVESWAGCRPILYTSPGFWDSLGTSAFGVYPLWVAEYGVSAPKIPTGWRSWTFWQYSQSGSISGITGSVDLDVFQGTLEELRSFSGSR
jgi:lysozyme